MKRKIREWISIQLARNPGLMVLATILLFNIVFLLLSAVLISNLSLTGTEHMGFLQAAFCTVTMILDAGCISFVIEDIGTSGVLIALVCLVIILTGMISFTGAVIGYITNYISNFIDNSNAGNRKLIVSNHMVILNWNTRASEIINDLLYAPTKQKVVVLVSARKKEIEKEIDERLSDTVGRENAAVAEQCRSYPFLKRYFYKKKNAFKKNVTVLVREGDVFSSKQLRDISLEHARMVVILGNDINNTICQFEHRERIEEMSRGNSQTVKTLMQVADITAAAYSDDNQKIIVEISDEWTSQLVDKIIKSKQVDGKCNIVPIYINKVLGQILSQFSLMPELNLVYKELFSNKGAAFFSEKKDGTDNIACIREYLANHRRALPLMYMDAKDGTHFYYACNGEKDIAHTAAVSTEGYRVKLNKDYWIEQKNVVILGHNNKCEDIMRGFRSFVGEWGTDPTGSDILRIVVIDDKKHLEKMKYYEKYPFVIETVEADIYDRDRICSAIDRFVSANTTDTSILILSDDAALNEDIDATALANLVYVQDIIRSKKENDPAFDTESIDVIVEIIDPKHHDLVSSYSVNNVVISNRYISKMITQIGEKEALYDFYCDILTYDTESESGYESKEIYTKKIYRYFNELPEKCTAEAFVRAVFEASAAYDENGGQNYAIPLGYVRPGGKMVLFSGDQADMTVSLDRRDKLIVFSNH